VTRDHTLSVLGIDEVLRRIREEQLITDLGKRELENPEGVGVDLRLGQIHTISEGGSYIEADGEDDLGHRKGVKTTLLGEWKKDAPNDFIEIHPGHYYLVRTIEGITTPLDLMPVIYTRGSLFKAGLLLVTSKCDPGYVGPLVFGLRNLSDFPAKLQLGARICNIVFFKIEGVGTAYRGQHQGGRVAITEKERQV
jgi:deoxycytidine triphosphate deaminase